MFTTFQAKNFPLFVDMQSFYDVTHYGKIMGYDKQYIDFKKLQLQEEEKSEKWRDFSQIKSWQGDELFFVVQIKKENIYKIWEIPQNSCLELKKKYTFYCKTNGLC